MSDEDKKILDLGSFDFTPDWARKSAGVSVGKGAERYRDEDERSRAEGGDRRPFGDRRPSSGGKSFGDRKSFGIRKSSGDRKPFGDRKSAAPRFQERPRPLDVEVKILPETKALGTIIRKLQQDTHAYKLKDLAYFFLDNPQSILLKITPRAGQRQSHLDSAPSTSNLQPPTFYQCKACGFASTREEDVLEHLVCAHLGDYYDAKETEVEAPKGNFNCVAKCGLSGVLLGPPNIHEFNATVREMIRTRYPEMSEEQYRAHIEMVRDAETIEAWRQGATKRTLFFAKGTADVEGARGLTREQAEGEFKRTIQASLLDTPKHLMITADVAMKSPVKPLVWAVRDAIEQERRNPFGICFALRGAFHHRKLHFFRVNDARGQEFVTNVEYREFDAAHAIPELARVAQFVAEHPCCDKSELGVEGEAEKHLGWLVSTGHVVAFTNGVYSQVEKYPKYGPQWKKRPAAAKTEEAKSPSLTSTSDPDPSRAVEQVEPAESNNQTIEETKNETSPVVAE